MAAGVSAKFKYKEKVYWISEILENCSQEDAEFIYTEGNMSCDCNRSRTINKRFPKFPKLDCGGKIELEYLLVI